MTRTSKLFYDLPSERLHAYDLALRESISDAVPANLLDFAGLPEDMVPYVGHWLNADLWGKAYGPEHERNCLADAVLYWRYRGTQVGFDLLSDRLCIDAEYTIDRADNEIQISASARVGAPLLVQARYIEQMYQQLAPIGWSVSITFLNGSRAPVYVSAAVRDTVYERFVW